MTEGDMGAVERSVSALVESMGALLPWERVTADQSLALARLVDLEHDGSKAASLSRELRQLTGTLARIGEKPAAAPVADDATPPADPIEGLIDEVARKRRERGSA